MVGTRAAFTAQRAPCGKVVDGEHYQDDDGEGFAIYDQFYACGCRRTQHQYHDGSITTSAIRHNGKVIVDERTPEHPV